ncbi:MAG TPA: S-methyl-5'-thioadenosine phosphorylase, partial [Acidimicrobiia bacterium]|nr:S-methyl-5'-thioadenosine phosphorylase [Acidimicrobiia bacterium]
MLVQAEIGVFGGSGFYTFGDDAEELELTTPFGAPSAPVTVADVRGRKVAFIPRHGRDHEYSPARVPAR